MDYVTPTTFKTVAQNGVVSDATLRRIDGLWRLEATIGNALSVLRHSKRQEPRLFRSADAGVNAAQELGLKRVNVEL